MLSIDLQQKSDNKEQLIKRAKSKFTKDLFEAKNHNGGATIFSDGTWNLIDLLDSLLYGKTAEELLFTTYSMTEPIARRLALMVDAGRIKKVTCILDAYMERRYPNIVQILKGFADIKYAELHAKICLIDLGCCNNITILGSANWTNNRRIESYCLKHNRIAGFLEDVKLIKSFTYDD